MKTPAHRVGVHWGVTLLLAIGRAPVGAASADRPHDMYVCANLSGPNQVMGSRKPVPSGLQRSRDRVTFTHVGPSHTRLYSVTRDPADARSLWVVAMDGVLRSRDLGESWRIMTDWQMTEPHAVAFEIHAPVRVYAGLPDGIAVSDDQGQTWRRSNDGIRRSYTHGLAVDRARAGCVLAGTELGIYLTEDGARSWRQVQATRKVTYDLRQSPHDAKRFLAATAADGAFLSNDSGRSWHVVAGVPRDHTLHNGDFDPANPQRIVLGGWNTGVLLSEDGGATWEDRSAGLPNREIWRVSFDPDLPGRLYAAPNLTPLFASDDLGRTWRPLAFEPSTVFDIVFVARE